MASLFLIIIILVLFLFTPQFTGFLSFFLSYSTINLLRYLHSPTIVMSTNNNSGPQNDRGKHKASNHHGNRESDGANQDSDHQQRPRKVLQPDYGSSFVPGAGPEHLAPKSLDHFKRGYQERAEQRDKEFTSPQRRVGGTPRLLGQRSQRDRPYSLPHQRLHQTIPHHAPSIPPTIPWSSRIDGTVATTATTVTTAPITILIINTLRGPQGQQQPIQNRIHGLVGNPNDPPFLMDLMYRNYWMLLTKIHTK